MNAHLSERFSRGSQASRQPPTIVQSVNLDLELNLDIRKYVEDQEKVRGRTKSEAWLDLPELPTSKEIAGAEGNEVTFAANKQRGPWRSKDKYLKAHYELLREDVTSPLREAVATYRSDPDMNDDKGVRIYEKV